MIHIEIHPPNKMRKTGAVYPYDVTLEGFTHTDESTQPIRDGLRAILEYMPASFDSPWTSTFQGIVSQSGDSARAMAGKTVIDGAQGTLQIRDSGYIKEHQEIYGEGGTFPYKVKEDAA